MRCGWRLLAASGIALAVLWQAAVATALTTVSIHDLSYDPTPYTANQGEVVTWQNNEATDIPHTTTGNGKLHFWDSSPHHPTDDLQPTETFSWEFDTAGTFSYHCKVHSTMHGQILVGLVFPDGLSDPFPHEITLQWASPSIPRGFNVDVQVRKPGATRWVTFYANKKGNFHGGNFKPGRRGNFSFRARTQRNSNGATSGYSPISVVNVF